MTRFTLTLLGSAPAESLFLSPDWWLVIGTWVLVLVTGLLIYVTGRTAQREANRHDEEMEKIKEAVELAAREEIRQQTRRRRKLAHTKAAEAETGGKSS
jgi:type VI protein secretion system component VasK